MESVPTIEEMRMRREVIALREALESAQFENEQKRSRQGSAHRDEIEELQAMVRGLRETLDQQGRAHEAALGEQRRHSGAEIRALQAALVEARKAFDAERVSLQAQQQAELVAAARVRTELERTVLRLREQLDGR